VFAQLPAGQFFFPASAKSGLFAKTTMRVLLRDVRTGLYFREPEAWTAQTEQALSFRHSADAMDRARAHRVAEAEVVLAFDETRHSVSLPLPGQTYLE
jgi:hypothetical protein